jgi:hypothetical protein
MAIANNAKDANSHTKSLDVSWVWKNKRFIRSRSPLATLDGSRFIIFCNSSTCFRFVVWVCRERTWLFPNILASTIYTKKFNSEFVWGAVGALSVSYRMLSWGLWWLVPITISVTFSIGLNRAGMTKSFKVYHIFMIRHPFNPLGGRTGTFIFSLQNPNSPALISSFCIFATRFLW